jgi:uncharacterized membrane protein
MKKLYSRRFDLFNATFFIGNAKQVLSNTTSKMPEHGFDLLMNVFVFFCIFFNEKGKIVKYGCGCF